MHPYITGTLRSPSGSVMEGVSSAVVFASSSAMKSSLVFQYTEGVTWEGRM